MSGANRMGSEHLGVVDNKGVAQSVLKCLPISGHAAANSTGQVPLAEKVTWVRRKASLRVGLHKRSPEAEAHRSWEKPSSGRENRSFDGKHLTVATQDTRTSNAYTQNTRT